MASYTIKTLKTLRLLEVMTNIDFIGCCVVSISFLTYTLLIVSQIKK